MEVNSFNTARFRNAEMVSLTTEILHLSSGYDWIGLNVEGFYTRVVISLKNFEEHLYKLNTVAETLHVEGNDLLFNNSWRAFKFFCNAIALDPDNAKREAANALINLSKIYGYNLHMKSYQEQNAKAKMFLNDCDSVVEVKAAIELIGADPFINNQKVALDALVLSLETRNVKMGDEVRDMDTKMLRKELMDNLEQMLKYLEAMSGLEIEGPLTGIIKNINVSIQKIEVLHKTRSSRSTENHAELQ